MKNLVAFRTFLCLCALFTTVSMQTCPNPFCGRSGDAGWKVLDRIMKWLDSDTASYFTEGASHFGVDINNKEQTTKLLCRISAVKSVEELAEITQVPEFFLSTFYQRLQKSLDVFGGFPGFQRTLRVDILAQLKNMGYPKFPLRFEPEGTQKYLAAMVKKYMGPIALTFPIFNDGRDMMKTLLKLISGTPDLEEFTTMLGWNLMAISPSDVDDIITFSEELQDMADILDAEGFFNLPLKPIVVTCGKIGTLSWNLLTGYIGIIDPKQREKLTQEASQLGLDLDNKDQTIELLCKIKDVKNVQELAAILQIPYSDFKDRYVYATMLLETYGGADGMSDYLDLILDILNKLKLTGYPKFPLDITREEAEAYLREAYEYYGEHKGLFPPFLEISDDYIHTLTSAFSAATSLENLEERLGFSLKSVAPSYIIKSDLKDLIDLADNMQNWIELPEAIQLFSLEM